LQAQGTETAARWKRGARPRDAQGERHAADAPIMR
jgi:hypothetical protein